MGLVQNAAIIYLSKWADHSDTRKAMRSALARIIVNKGYAVEEYPWHELRYEDVRGICAQLAVKDYKPPTINQSLSALRGVLEAAWRSGRMSEDIYRRIEIENAPGNSKRAGRALTSAELDAIAAALPTSTSRDAAVVAVLAGAGLRRVELVRLVGSNYDQTTGRLTATGKRNKTRSIPVGNRWCPIIEAWWRTRQPASLLFEFDSKNPRREVSYVVESFCVKHKLPSFTPHDLRRTFGTHVERVAGIAMAQQLLGHTNIQTTTLYVRIDEERERAAVRNL